MPELKYENHKPDYIHHNCNPDYKRKETTNKKGRECPNLTEKTKSDLHGFTQEQRNVWYSTSTLTIYPDFHNNRVPIINLWSEKDPPSWLSGQAAHLNSVTLLNPKPQSFHQRGPMEKLNWTPKGARLCGHGGGIWLDKHTGQPQTCSASARWWCDERQAARLKEEEEGCIYRAHCVPAGSELRRDEGGGRLSIHVEQWHPQSLFIKNRPHYPACTSYFCLQRAGDSGYSKVGRVFVRHPAPSLRVHQQETRLIYQLKPIICVLVPVGSYNELGCRGKQWADLWCMWVWVGAVKKQERSHKRFIG